MDVKQLILGVVQEMENVLIISVFFLKECLLEKDVLLDLLLVDFNVVMMDNFVMV
jgi:hypothetical protein